MVPAREADKCFLLFKLDEWSDSSNVLLVTLELFSEVVDVSGGDSLSITSCVACNSFANGFSLASSPFLPNDTMKLTPNFDFKEMVGLVSSAI